MAKPARKYILIPEHRPLYAMTRCWGKPTGPLTEPTPTPLDVIGDLLRQTDNEAVTVREVIQLTNPETGAKSWSDPVLLTLENYTLPYAEIVGGATVAPTNVSPTPVPKKAPVAPTSEPPKPADTKNILVHRDDVIPSEAKIYSATLSTAAMDENGNIIKIETKENDVPETPADYVTSGYIAPVDAEPTPAGVVTVTNNDPVVLNMNTGEITPAITEEKKIVVELGVSNDDAAPAEPAAEEPEEQVERANNEEDLGTAMNLPEEEKSTANPDDPWPNMTDEERAAYAKMSKSERRAARRAHREQQALAEMEAERTAAKSDK